MPKAVRTEPDSFDDHVFAIERFVDEFRSCCIHGTRIERRRHLFGQDFSIILRRVVVDYNRLAGFVERREEGEALDVIPVRVAEQDMDRLPLFAGISPGFAPEFRAEPVDAGSRIDDNPALESRTPDFKASRVRAHSDGYSYQTQGRFPGTPKRRSLTSRSLDHPPISQVTTVRSSKLVSGACERVNPIEEPVDPFFPADFFSCHKRYEPVDAKHVSLHVDGLCKAIRVGHETVAGLQRFLTRGELSVRIESERDAGFRGQAVDRSIGAASQYRRMAGACHLHESLLQIEKHHDEGDEPAPYEPLLQDVVQFEDDFGGVAFLECEAAQIRHDAGHV